VSEVRRVRATSWKDSNNVVHQTDPGDYMTHCKINTYGERTNTPFEFSNEPITCLVCVTRRNI
jgi:hypothetical protein